MKSSYELLREKNIARNESRLAKLGLLKNQTSLVAQLNNNADTAAGNDSKSRKKTKKTKEKVTSVRRSLRKRRPNVNYKEDTISIQQKQILRSDTMSDAVIPSNPFITEKVKTTSIHVDKIVEYCLGKQFVKSGKAFAINSAVQCTQSKSLKEYEENLSTSSISNLSFNKFSGVLQWKNSAFFLWVNMEKNLSDTGICNEFLDGGRKVTWFGGSKMHDETPAINKLIATGKKAMRQKKEDALNEPNGILLFCRTFDEKKRAMPYVCMGRVGYHSHIPNSRPLKFVWNLLDFDRLMKVSAFIEERNSNPSLFDQIMNS